MENTELLDPNRKEEKARRINQIKEIQIFIKKEKYNRTIQNFQGN